MQYNFDWDPAKERKNIHKHRVSFRQAATVFRDPNHISIYDEDHSMYEDRWITIGIDQSAIHRVIVHTFKKLGETTIEIRIISARKANRKEKNQYTKSELL